jgi:hypothetical protein
MPRPLHHELDRNPKIYSMQSLTNMQFYVGSTRQLFRTRINMHKANYRAGHNTTSASSILAAGDFISQVLEYCDADISKEELAARELFHINDLRRRGSTVINKNTPGRDKKSWYLDNRDRILARTRRQREELNNANMQFNEACAELRHIALE